MSEEVLQQFQKAMDAVIEALRPVVEAVAEFCRAVNDAFFAEYRARGAIYGDTDAGMLRWLDELHMIVRLRQQADYLEARQQALVIR